MSLTFAGHVQLRKQNLGQLLEDSGLLPAVWAPPAGLPGAEPQLQGQELPGDALVQSVQDALRAQPVVHRLRPRRPLRPRRQQRLDHRPQVNELLGVPHSSPRMPSLDIAPHSGGYVGHSTKPSQGPAPVADSFPADLTFDLLEIRVQATQLSPCHAGPSTPRLHCLSPPSGTRHRRRDESPFRSARLQRAWRASRGSRPRRVSGRRHRVLRVDVEEPFGP